MERLVLDQRNCIMTLSGVLCAEECTALIARAEEHCFTDAPITTARGFVHRPDIRNNTRVMLDDERLAEELWRRVRTVVPAQISHWRAIGLNERLRFYRYDSGQAFRWHYDGPFVRSSAEESLLTFMVYLNDEFTGGATEFENGPTVRPVRGMALLFLHPVLHQGAEVHQGRKYVLRTDVMYRRAAGSTT